MIELLLDWGKLILFFLFWCIVAAIAYEGIQQQVERHERRQRRKKENQKFRYYKENRRD